MGNPNPDHNPNPNTNPNPNPNPNPNQCPNPNPNPNADPNPDPAPNPDPKGIMTVAAARAIAAVLVKPLRLSFEGWLGLGLLYAVGRGLSATTGGIVTSRK